MGWISVKDARAKVDNAVSLQTVYKLVHAGVVRGLKIGGRILVDDEDLARYVKRAGLEVIRPRQVEQPPRTGGRQLSRKEHFDSM